MTHISVPVDVFFLIVPFIFMLILSMYIENHPRVFLTTRQWFIYLIGIPSALILSLISWSIYHFWIK